MIGNTGTIDYRKTNAWKGMLLLRVARVDTIHGNLEFLTDGRFANRSTMLFMEPVASAARAWTDTEMAAEISRAGQGVVSYTDAFRRTYEASAFCGAFPTCLLTALPGKRSGMDNGNTCEC